LDELRQHGMEVEIGTPLPAGNPNSEFSSSGGEVVSPMEGPAKSSLE
jgi:hypothetical protein